MKLRASLVAIAALASMASAGGITLYEDVKTKQIFTEPGEGRQKVGNFIQENNVAELMSKEVKGIPVTSKAKKLEFSGTHYFGLTSVNPNDTSSTGVNGSTGFELRRNYVQVKAYFTDKDFFRVTLDTTKEIGSSKTYADMYAKYAYLWLDNVLPYTGVEIGIAHRPWIDYEEHNAWKYRSINKVALEQKTNEVDNGPDLINSADLGFNFKTKTEYFTSEIGIFNGEGYHADKAAANQENSSDLSLEWRLTGHLLGSGKKVGKQVADKDTYAHISTYGMISKNHKDNDVVENDAAEYDRSIYGIHAVYNNPMFLLAGQYYIAKDDAQNESVGDSKDYKGWSINGELRPVKNWTVLARYDVSDIDKKAKLTGNESKLQDMTSALVGVAYKYNKNVTFIASGKQITDDTETSAPSTLAGVKEKNVYMFTTEVKW